MFSQRCLSFMNSEVPEIPIKEHSAACKDYLWSFGRLILRITTGKKTVQVSKRNPRGLVLTTAMERAADSCQWDLKNWSCHSTGPQFIRTYPGEAKRVSWSKTSGILVNFPSPLPTRNTSIDCTEQKRESCLLHTAFMFSSQMANFQGYPKQMLPPKKLPVLINPFIKDRSVLLPLFPRTGTY